MTYILPKVHIKWRKEVQALTNSLDDGKDQKTQKAMDKVLSAEKNVQLVVLNGDLISGEATQASNSSTYLDRVVAPVVYHNLPWASTYGNHDSNPNLDPEEIFRREKNYTNSLTQRSVPGSAAGITNYYLPIFEHDASNTTTPTFILWFFDSRGGNYPTKKGDDGKIVSRPDWVDNSVSIICRIPSSRFLGNTY